MEQEERRFLQMQFLFSVWLLRCWKNNPRLRQLGVIVYCCSMNLEDKSLLAFELSEDKAEKVYIPMGDYSLVQTEEIREDIGKRIKENVEKFYGLR